MIQLLMSLIAFVYVENALASITINFSNSTLQTNPQGTFNIGTPTFQSGLWIPGPQPLGEGQVVTPSGTWCMAFKGAFKGFQMGFDPVISFLGHPSIFYSFGPTAKRSKYGCSPTNPCFTGSPGHGADRAIHQTPSGDCKLSGSSYTGIAPYGIGMVANKPIYIGMAIYIEAKAWGFDNTSSESIIFELFQPDLLLMMGNNNLDYITVVNHPTEQIPFTTDRWNYIVLGLLSNTVDPTKSFVQIWKVEGKGGWLKKTAKLHVNMQGYKFEHPAGPWSINWGIYRGKKKISQKINFGEINVGDTISEAMPQL